MAVRSPFRFDTFPIGGAFLSFPNTYLQCYHIQIFFRNFYAIFQIIDFFFTSLGSKSTFAYFMSSLIIKSHSDSLICFLNHRNYLESHLSMLNQMEQTHDDWTSMDNAAVDLVLKWMNDTKPKTGIRKLAPVLNMTYAQLQPTLQKKSKTPLSMGLFYKCANYFGRKPVESYVQCCMLAAIYDNNYKLASAMHATYLDLSVHEATENLARKYLNSTDKSLELAADTFLQSPNVSADTIDKFLNSES